MGFALPLQILSAQIISYSFISLFFYLFEVHNYNLFVTLLLEPKGFTVLEITASRFKASSYSPQTHLSFFSAACYTNKNIFNYGYEVLTAVFLKINVFWDSYTVSAVKYYSRVSFYDGVTFSNIWL